jgi:hypothetical protein
VKHSTFRLWLGGTVLSGYFLCLTLILFFLTSDGLEFPTVKELAKQLLPVFVGAASTTLSLAKTNRKTRGRISKGMAIISISIVGLCSAALPTTIVLHAFNVGEFKYPEVFLFGLSVIQTVLLAVVGWWLPRIAGGVQD